MCIESLQESVVADSCFGLNIYEFVGAGVAVENRLACSRKFVYGGAKDRGNV